MIEPEPQFYVTFVVEQCRYAIRAWEVAREAIEVGPRLRLLVGAQLPGASRADHLKEDNLDRVWMNVQSFLTFAGNVSKMLFSDGGSGYRSKRAEALRRHLGVSDSSPLKSRTLRNCLEHFDERVDDWAKLSHQHRNGQSIMADRLVGQRGTKWITSGRQQPIDSRNQFRAIDPETMVVTFQGEDYELLPILEELRRIESFPTPSI